MSARKRPPRRKVKLLYPEGDFDGFGTDPADSMRLCELREAIDAHLVWPSAKAEEDGDYIAAVKHSGALAKRLTVEKTKARRK